MCKFVNLFDSATGRTYMIFSYNLTPTTTKKMTLFGTKSRYYIDYEIIIIIIIIMTTTIIKDRLRYSASIETPLER